MKVIDAAMFTHTMAFQQYTVMSDKPIIASSHVAINVNLHLCYLSFSSCPGFLFSFSIFFLWGFHLKDQTLSLPFNNAVSIIHFYMYRPFSPLFDREICYARPGQPASRWHRPQRAVRWNHGSHLLCAARGYQQEHGECQSPGRLGWDREAGEHNQGPRRQASLLQGNTSWGPCLRKYICSHMTSLFCTLLSCTQPVMLSYVCLISFKTISGMSGPGKVQGYHKKTRESISFGLSLCFKLRSRFCRSLYVT